MSVPINYVLGCTCLVGERGLTRVGRQRLTVLSKQRAQVGVYGRLLRALPAGTVFGSQPRGLSDGGVGSPTLSFTSSRNQTVRERVPGSERRSKDREMAGNSPYKSRGR